VHALAIGPSDAVVGISASGTTPYVLGALETAAEVGALTAGVVSARDSELGALVEHEIAVVVGPEFLAGSTRLKAGTAQKLVLNTISTISMIRLGKTYGNLMVDVVAGNEKLRDRVRRIVGAATGASSEQVDEALADAGGGRPRRHRLAPRRSRRRHRARASRCLREKHRLRAGERAMRLGVEAALVDGTLVRATSRSSAAHRRLRPRVAERPGHRGTGFVDLRSTASRGSTS
jgi:hypothetical protein